MIILLRNKDSSKVPKPVYIFSRLRSLDLNDIALTIPFMFTMTAVKPDHKPSKPDNEHFKPDKKHAKPVQPKEKPVKPRRSTSSPT